MPGGKAFPAIVDQSGSVSIEPRAVLFFLRKRERETDGDGFDIGGKNSKRMSWLGKLGILNSNSNHFTTCLLIFILHFSPQLPPCLFKFENKSLDPLLRPSSSIRAGSSGSSGSSDRRSGDDCRYGVWKQE